MHISKFLVVWERSVGSHCGCVQGFLVKVTETSVELFSFFFLLFFFLPLWLCSLRSCPCVMFSSQKVVGMSETLEFPELCKQSNEPSHPVHLLVWLCCQTHLLHSPSAQKVSGELNIKIRAEFARLHQILEEEERAVLVELGEKEEQSLTRLHGDIHQLEEGVSVLQRDIERIEQTLSKVEEVSLLEVSVLGRPWQKDEESGYEFGVGESTRLSLPSLWIIYPFPWGLEALATRDMVIFPMWWVSGAFLLFCHPREIALAAAPRHFPPGSGSWRVGFLSLCFMTAGGRTGSLFCAAA